MPQPRNVYEWNEQNNRRRREAFHDPANPRNNLDYGGTGGTADRGRGGGGARTSEPPPGGGGSQPLRDGQLQEIIDQLQKQNGGGAGGLGPANLSNIGLGGGGGAAPANDPRIAALIAQRLSQNGLPNLDPETLARLQATTDSNLMDLDETFAGQRQGLLEDLFGRGINRSSIAGDVGGQLVEGYGRARQSVLSDAAQRELATAQDARNFLLQQALGIGDLYSRENASKATVQAANINANSVLGSARLQAEASNFATRSRYQQTLLEDRTRRLLGGGDLLQRDQALRQEGQLTREEFDVRKWIAELQARTQLEGIDATKPKWWERLLGGIGSIFSSVQYKRDFSPLTAEQRQEITDTVLNSKLWRYRYQGDNNDYQERIGVMLEDADPMFKNDLAGDRLDLPRIMFMLMVAVQDLAERIDS